MPGRGPNMPLHQRTFTCHRRGHQADRDHNAAVNLGIWAEQHHAQVRDLRAGARSPTPAEGRLWPARSHGRNRPRRRRNHTNPAQGEARTSEKDAVSQLQRVMKRAVDG